MGYRCLEGPSLPTLWGLLFWCHFVSATCLVLQLEGRQSPWLGTQTTARQSGFQSWLCSYLACLSLSFLIYNTGVITVHMP
jgi:hypothetical protein